jgi:hypothetical protein
MTGGALSHVLERSATLVAMRINPEKQDKCVGIVKVVPCFRHSIGRTTPGSATR